jgi:hypothetical protein
MFSYNRLTAKNDYLMPPAFQKMYSPVQNIVISFPNQLILSQKPARNEIRIDHL